MNIYRAMHRSTGLFYRPVRGVKLKFRDVDLYVKSNLSKNPKLYQKLPSISMLSGTFYSHIEAMKILDQEFLMHGSTERLRWNRNNVSKLYQFFSGEWEVQRLHGDNWIPIGDLKP